jgi:hypothetical protein
LYHDFSETLLVPAKSEYDLLERFANLLRKPIYLQNEKKIPTEAPMEILDGFPSCLGSNGNPGWIPLLSS